MKNGQTERDGLKYKNRWVNKSNSQNAKWNTQQRAIWLWGTYDVELK